MSKSTEQYESNPFSVTFRGLDWLFKYNQSLAIVILVVTALFMAPQFTFNSTAPTPNQVQNGTQLPAASTEFSLQLGLLVLLLIVCALVVALLVSTVITAFLSFVSWKTSRKETTTFSETWKAVTSNFRSLLVVELIAWVKIIGGLILFIVPGIRAYLRYQMVMFPIFERGAKPREAIQEMKGLTSGRLIELFGISTVAGLIPFVGGVLQLGGLAVAYPQLNAIKTSSEKPKKHWLNYIGFIILGFIALAISLVFLLLATI